MTSEDKKKVVKKFKKIVGKASPEELAKLNVSIGARKLGIDPTDLCHAFKSHNCSAGKFMKMKKFFSFERLIISRRAKNLKQALKILDIQSESNFIRQYKAFRHQTPGETIRLLKKELAKYKNSVDEDQLISFLDKHIEARTQYLKNPIVKG
ncbi:MAG: helix-turn-helix domain-containing protein [Acidobacteria bacterium]|jgi:hypothetical protein|nr:helix-turn-helix domain-containing protein [Acidobacteriota bacterium]